MSENVYVSIMKLNDSLERLEILHNSDYDLSSLEVVSGELAGRTFTGRDLFDAMIALRTEIEAVGGKLLCAGARRDVWPSGMSRSMGSARKAYVMELGKAGTTLVDIFDPADPADVGTVAEQRDFHERWKAAWLEKTRT